MVFAISSLLTTLLLMVFKEARGSFRRGGASELKACRLFSWRRPLLSILCTAVCELLPHALTPTLANKLRADFDFTTP